MKKGDVWIVSVDGGQESYRRIKDPASLFTATVAIPFEAMGEKAVDALDRIAVKKIPRDKVVSGPYMWVDSVLVDSSNVDKYLAK
jgi:simple sugar transport system substrate-binding protein/ribose transport system substrate-binding protein